MNLARSPSRALFVALLALGSVSCWSYPGPARSALSSERGQKNVRTDPLATQALAINREDFLAGLGERGWDLEAPRAAFQRAMSNGDLAHAKLALEECARAARNSDLPEIEIDLRLDTIILCRNNPELRPEPGDLARQIEWTIPERAAFERLYEPRLSNEALVRFHSVLGLVYADLGRWTLDDWQAAPRHLSLALLACCDPQPRLAHRLAQGLRASDDPSGALDAFREAVLGYVALGETREARKAYTDAEAEMRRACQELSYDLRVMDDVLYQRYGWYAGAGGGFTNSSGSSSQIKDDLSGLGHQTSVSFDDGDFGGKLYGGYRFMNPFAIEFGLTGMEGSKSKIVEKEPTTPNICGNVAGVHPVTGRGLATSLVGYPYEGQDFSLFGRVGAWIWQADVDVEVEGQEPCNFSDSGWDFFYGVGVEYRIERSWRARFEWERYEFNQDAIDLVSVGVTYSL